MSLNDDARGLSRQGDAEKFNSELAKYQTWLAEKQLRSTTTQTKVNFEAFFNHFEPFYSGAGAVRRGLRAGRRCRWLGWIGAAATARRSG